MTVTNDYLPFGTGTGNIATDQADYAASTVRTLGPQTGFADPNLATKTWRQSSMVASMIAQWISDTLAVSVVDDGNVSALESLFQDALTSYVNAPSPASLVHYGADSGTVNALSIAALPTISALRAGMVLITYPTTTAVAASAQQPASIVTTGATNLTATLLRADGTPIQANDYFAGRLTVFVTDSNLRWRLYGQTSQAAQNGGFAQNSSGNFLLALLTNLVADNRPAPVAADVLPLGRAADGAMVSVLCSALATYVISNIVQQGGNVLPNIVDVTSEPLVYSQFVAGGDYVNTEGAANVTCTNGKFTLTLPETSPFQTSNFSWFVQDGNSQGIGCHITGVSTSSNTFSGFATNLGTNPPSPFTGTLSVKYFAVGLIGNS